MNRRTVVLLSAVTLFTLPVVGNLKVDIYGYTKLDVQYNSKNTGSLPSPPPNFVPFNGDKANSHGELVLDARESRFGIKANDQYKYVSMLGVVEVDFFTIDGNAIVNNGRAPRLRLAYGRGDLNNGFFVLGGQNWTLFMNDQMGQPNLIDFNGPVGAISSREPQLRVGYKKEISPKIGTFMAQASFEKQAVNVVPSGFVDPAILADPSQGSGQNFPLVVAKLSWMQKYFQMEIAGAGAQCDIVLNETGRQTKKDVWAAQATMQLNVNKLTLYTSANHLVGLSRLDAADFIDGVITSHNHFKPVHSDAWYLGGAWAFTPQLSINTVYGWNRALEIPGTAISGDAQNKYTSFHINVIQQFWTRWQTGLEFEQLNSHTFNGQRGKVNILHTAVYYFF
jgi:hypothetical protein